MGIVAAALLAGGAFPAPGRAETASAEQELLGLLDAPLLFVARHSYTGIHIYDVFYKWPPGGGGIYVLENPAAPRDDWRIRAVIDPTTPETLGVGVYSDPALSPDAQRLLFCHKGDPNGDTSIYEIGIDGHGLRRITDPSAHADDNRGSFAGQHDISPEYLPDGRIVFLSTRPSGLVPCFNSGVAILHVMRADGSDIHPISVNNVNEFDPTVMPDGRLLFGRWEYVDKNALTIQSLWTVNPDGTQETALYANNMVFPEAILDARCVPDSHLIVGTLAKHNGTPRGSIAWIDPRIGKNSPDAIINLEHPEDPTYDRGDSCEPWPLGDQAVLFSGRPPGATRNVIEILDRAGRRIVVHSDPDICLHSPMLVKPSPVPAALPDTIDRQQTTGQFVVQDIYRGLEGVERGEIKWLRVLEETSRTSPRPAGKNPYNQTFLVSCALAFSTKNFLGVVPVEADGSVCFEVPAGRALYLQALDEDGRLVQSMRTFVQAAPGTTRSCIGCHEHKFTTSPAEENLSSCMERPPAQLQPESWGTGFLDYTRRVQPILDRHCTSCHGGEQGIAGGIDLSGGWTEHFNISYENLTNRCETQLIAHWIAGIDCMNGTAMWSAQRFPPRSHGSGAAPLADLLVDGHDDRLPDLTRQERDLLMAWIDTNGLFHGTWNYTEHGSALSHWGQTRQALVDEMQAAGCLKCHGDGRQIATFENDWINLQAPEMSRLLRAPLAPGSDGYGLGWCRERQVTAEDRRLRLLWNGYAHAVQPAEAFPRQERRRPDRTGDPVVSFTSPADPHYQALLAIIDSARQQALAAPRIDMPGAEPVAGTCRLLVESPLPETAPPLAAGVEFDGAIRISWMQSAGTIGLEAEVHRALQPDFVPDATTLVARTWLDEVLDTQAPAGSVYYALVLTDGEQRTRPSYTDVRAPEAPAPCAPEGLAVLSASWAVQLEWQPPSVAFQRYHVYRRAPGESSFTLLNDTPVVGSRYADSAVTPDRSYEYLVRTISRCGVLSEPAGPVLATCQAIEGPMFALAAEESPAGAVSGVPCGRLHGGRPLTGKVHGKARVDQGVVQLSDGGHVTFPHRAVFDLGQPLSVSCRVRIDRRTKMPVVVSCGHWRQGGWFLQWLGDRWRWHVGGVDCDGGTPVAGRWMQLTGVFDGRSARLYQDGQLVAEATGEFRTQPWSGDLHIGQYSAGPSTDYQVLGSVDQLQIFHRPLDR